MSNATLYLKARFASVRAAHKALKRTKKFLRGMAKANEDWHAIRGDIGRSVSERFNALKAKHREVFELLEIDKLVMHKMARDRRMNFLAGQLESPFGRPKWFLCQDGKLIGFNGQVSEDANWQSLTGVMRKFGAIDVDYISDKRIDPYSLLRV